MSEKKTKKRTANERDNDKKLQESPSFLQEKKPSKRARLDPSPQAADTNTMKNTPSFGVDSNKSQTDSNAGDFYQRVSELKLNDPMLKLLIAPEEMNAQKKRKYEGKFEELSDQFRQRGITKEMRARIEKFSKEEKNYKKINLNDRMKQKKVAVVNREQFQVLMQDELDFEKLEKMIERLQTNQSPSKAEQDELLDIFIAAYFIKFSHSMEKNIVKKTQKDRETEFNAIRCFLRSKVSSWDQKVATWFITYKEHVNAYLGDADIQSLKPLLQQNAQLFKAAKPDHKFKLPEKPDVDTCIQIILKSVNADDTTVNGGSRQHLYPNQRSKAVRPKPSATWSTPQLNLENLLELLNYDSSTSRSSIFEEKKLPPPLSKECGTYPSHPVLRSDKMPSEYELAKQVKQQNFAVPLPEKMTKIESTQSLISKMKQQHNDKNAFFGSQKFDTPVDKPSDKTKPKSGMKALPTVEQIMIENLSSNRSPLIGQMSQEENFKHPLIRASPRNSVRQMTMTNRELQRGLSDTSFSHLLNQPQPHPQTTPNRTTSDFLRMSALQHTEGILGLPSVPRGLGKEASAMSTSSLERQLAKVNARREAFGGSAAANGHNFGDCSAMLGELMGAHSRGNGGGVMDFDDEAFPLLAKDQSAADAGADAPKEPGTAGAETEKLSVGSHKSKKSGYSLGFSKNI